MTLPALREPTPSLVASYVAQFEGDAQTAATDRVVARLFQAYPRNRDIEDVLLKVVALNGLYSTNIYGTYAVAMHICALDIDPQLERNSVDVVDQVARVRLGGKAKHLYSFATKYCSWHVPDAYPIYDTFIEQLMWAYGESGRFAQFARTDLRDYPRFKEIVERFQAYYGLTEFSFKQLDKFLWRYGRELFAPDRWL
jgi:hypothetical protein